MPEIPPRIPRVRMSPEERHLRSQLVQLLSGAGLLRSTYDRKQGGLAFLHDEIAEVLVDSIPRDVRRNNSKPTSCSSSLTCSLTADCEIFRRFAALVKLRSL